MRVLVACEYSGRVRDAFIARGHDAMSCDLLPTESPGPHYQGDIRDVLESVRMNDGMGFDLLIAHPDCTFLTVSAAWAYGPGPYHQKIKPGTLTGDERIAAREDAIRFVEALWNAPIKMKAIENPIGVLSTRFRKPTQIINPHQFGHDASKATCLWLDNLPPLIPTRHIAPRIVMHNGKQVKRWGNQTDSGQNKLTPSADRWKDRARTYQGWADAMAEQWGAVKPHNIK